MLVLVFLFVLGITVGSFLNVISLRYREDERLLDPTRIGGRSHCPGCGKTLAWYELIPLVSFLLQKGRCRKCKMQLSPQYPLMEIAGGLVPTLTFVAFQSLYGLNGFFDYLSLSTLIVTGWILILMAAIDFRLMIIPDEIVIFVSLLGGCMVLFQLLAQKNYTVYAPLDNLWLSNVLGALVGLFFLGLIYLISDGRAMGFGDVKLIIPLGLIAGWRGVLFLLSISFIIGGAFASGLIITRRKERKEMVPFGPFLAAGFFVLIWWGREILNLYLSFLNL